MEEWDREEKIKFFNLHFIIICEKSTGFDQEKEKVCLSKQDILHFIRE